MIHRCHCNLMFYSIDQNIGTIKNSLFSDKRLVLTDKGLFRLDWNTGKQKLIHNLKEIKNITGNRIAVYEI